jgi:ParE toxin of type II toxin-antitoxin system, parDE
VLKEWLKLLNYPVRRTILPKFGITSPMTVKHKPICLLIRLPPVGYANDRKLQLLAEQPNLGRSRGELAENMRSFPIGHYVIFYVVMPSCIQVVRVLHGARDLAPIFDTDN